MNPYVKYWQSALQKTITNKPRKIMTPGECAQQKIRMSESLLKSAFEKESKLFLAEFQKPEYIPSQGCDAHIVNLFNTHLDVLFVNCVKDYIHLCVFNYFSSLKIKRESANDAQKAFILRPYEEDTLGRIKEDLAKMLIFFYKVHNSISDAVSEMVSDRQVKADKMADLLKNGWQQLCNFSYEMQIAAKLKGFELSGRKQYRYVCENSDSSCEICMELDGRNFDIDEANFGTNLPPMHPNCRCTITESPPLPELLQFPAILDWTILGDVRDGLEGIIQRAAIGLDNLADGLGDIWNFFFRKSLDDCYGTYTTIEIDGKEYRINKASFESVVIMPDGSFLVPEIVTETDKMLLSMMKERDSLPEGDPKRTEINNLMKEICNTEPKPARSVAYLKPYSFYLFGGDVTEKLNDYMKNAASNYADMHDRYWVENLLDFKNLVANKQEMDLKNQPEWQNSAFIYDGEVVSQDALGNINYGYFGSYCNIPQSALMAGAGYAQWSSGNWEWGFITTILDDPRDTYRVFQGIEIYEEQN